MVAGGGGRNYATILLLDQVVADRKNCISLVRVITDTLLMYVLFRRKRPPPAIVSTVAGGGGLLQNLLGAMYSMSKCIKS